MINNKRDNESSLTRAAFSSSRWTTKEQKGEWRQRFKQRCLQTAKKYREQVKNKFRKSPTITTTTTIDSDKEMALDVGPASNTQSANTNSFLSNMSLVGQTPSIIIKDLTNIPSVGAPIKKNDEVARFVQNQWKQFKHEELLNPDERLTTEEYINLMQSLEEALYKDLAREEQQMLSASLFESEKRWEEEALMATIANNTPNCAICPLCKRHKLTQNQRVISCQCGMRIDTKCNQINLAYVHKVLTDANNEHSSRCKYEPVFTVINDYGTAALYMICNYCSTIQTVL